MTRCPFVRVFGVPFVAAPFIAALGSAAVTARALPAQSNRPAHAWRAIRPLAGIALSASTSTILTIPKRVHRWRIPTSMCGRVIS